MEIIDRIENEELRNFCNCPKEYQLIDFFGAFLGAFFLVQNAIFLSKRFNYLNIAGIGLGAIMFYIHTARFWWAEDVKSGAREIEF